MVFLTVDLQQALSKVAKGSTNNTFIPISSMLQIHCVNGSTAVMLTTTDGNYTLSVVCNQSDDALKDSVFTVDLNIFNKLINSFSSEYIMINEKDGKLLITGNGNYTIPLQTDEGNDIKFPTIPVDGKTTGTIYADKIRDIVKYHKASLPTTNQEKSTMPNLLGYYFSKDGNFTTNGIMVCNSTINVFAEKTILPPEIVELLAEFDDVIEYTENDNGSYIFHDGIMSICFTNTLNVDEYPYEPLSNLIKTEFTQSFSIERKYFINVLNRISLFISPYDDLGIKMSVIASGVDSGITITTKNKSGDEKLISIKSDSNTEETFSIKVNVEFLKQQLKAMTNDFVSLNFGGNRCLCILDEQTIRLIALQEEK